MLTRPMLPTFELLPPGGGFQVPRTLPTDIPLQPNLSTAVNQAGNPLRNECKIAKINVPLTVCGVTYPVNVCCSRGEKMRFVGKENTFPKFAFHPMGWG